MSIKSDNWIRRMAREHGHDRAVRGRAGAGRPTATRSSPTARRATATTCAAPASSRSSPTSTRRSSIRSIRREELRRFRRRCLHHSAELLRAGADRGVLPDSAQCAHYLPGEMRHAVTRAWSMRKPVLTFPSPRCASVRRHWGWTAGRLSPRRCRRSSHRERGRCTSCAPRLACAFAPRAIIPSGHSGAGCH